jgi:tRNA (adenine22-N1)-methyltransferase
VVSGPILRAKSNINKYQLSDRITTLQTSGLEGIEPYAPDDILLCGMGGELIASLLEKSDYSKNNSVRLILQPMTMSDRLRIWLTKNGFSILDEHLVAEHNGSKVYQLLYVTYTGIVAELTPLQALIGPCNLEKREPLFEVHVQKCREGLCKKQRGMQQADLDSHLLLELIHQLDCL